MKPNRNKTGGSDIYDENRRSWIMSRVKGRGNLSTEMRLIRIFKDGKITGWRRHSKLFGRPDFTFYKERVVIFVDGCFWHGCRIHSSLPKQNSVFWKQKIDSNKTRDRLVNRTLRAKYWQVLRIWEHELKNANRSILLRKLRRGLNQINTSSNCSSEEHRRHLIR